MVSMMFMAIGCRLISTLTAALSVEGPDVIIDDSWWLLVDMFVEDLPSEERYVILSVQRPIERDSGFIACELIWRQGHSLYISFALPFTSLDLLRSFFDQIICKAIQKAQLVFFSIAGILSTVHGQRSETAGALTVPKHSRRGRPFQQAVHRRKA